MNIKGWSIEETMELFVDIFDYDKNYLQEATEYINNGAEDLSYL